MYHLTPAQWRLIDPAYQVEFEGRLFFRDFDLTMTQHLVEVELTDTPPEPAVPEHYRDLWPLDPRD
jgi:hypothetical protein